MKTINTLFAALGLGFISHATACTHCDSSLNFGFSGSMGITRYESAYRRDGQSTLGRLSLNGQYAFTDFFALGLEAGVQNGNTLRLNLSKSTLDSLGGEPVSILVKPLVDLLFTAQIIPFEDNGFFGFVKGGIAYRQAQVDRNEVNDLSKAVAEFQAGFGYKINDNLALQFGYQQIFGGHPNYQVNSLTECATIFNIPTQKGVLMGISLII